MATTAVAAATVAGVAVAEATAAAAAAAWWTPCEVKAVGGAIPLVAGCGVKPLDGDGGVKLPQQNNGVTPLGGTAVRSRHEDRREAGWQWCPGWCDAIREMGRYDDVATGTAKVSSTSRVGCCVRKTAWSSALLGRHPQQDDPWRPTLRRRCPPQVSAAPRWRVKWRQVVRVEDYDIKIRG